MSRLAFRSLRAFVAILALALSALGSPRSAWERCDFWDHDEAQAAAVAANRDVRTVADHGVAGSPDVEKVRATQAGLVRSVPPMVSADLACPGPRCGSALGARAPDSAA